jgi:hypothetical protein
MTVLSFAFCKYQDQFGLVRSYEHGYLTVQFDDGIKHLKPVDVEFL